MIGNRMHIAGVMVCVVAVVASVGGCSQPSPTSDESAAEASTDESTGDRESGTTSSTAAASEEASSSKKDACLGKVTPPRGAGGKQYLQEPAVAADLEIDVVVERAREKLLERLCQGYRCETLAPEIQTWEIQESGPYKCSKAVISKSVYDEWVVEHKEDVDNKLRRVAKSLVEKVSDGEDGDLRLAIEPIRDHRAVGGARAQWLYDKLQTALTGADAALVRHRETFSGGRHGIDGVVGGEIYTLEGFEKLLEVSLRIEADGAVQRADSVKFPEAFTPDVDPTTYVPKIPEGDGSVDLHFDYQPGGGFCNGQTFRIWLETTEDLYVRLVSLYGKAGGLVIYPREEQSELIEAGEPVPLGEFQALSAEPAPVERWAVLAAPTREELGKFDSVGAVCKLPRSFANDLQNGRGLTPAVRDRLEVQTYRIMRDTERCRNYEVDEQLLQRSKETLANTGFCWSDDK